MADASMFRLELLHPITVHFPIALLCFGVALEIALFIRAGIQKKVSPFLSAAGSLLLAAGALGAWVAYATGSLAEETVAEYICNPKQIEAHEAYAITAAILFSLAAVISALRFAPRAAEVLEGARQKFIAHTLFVLLLLAGLGSLAFAAHQGGELVYLQGAGVQGVARDCPSTLVAEPGAAARE